MLAVIAIAIYVECDDINHRGTGSAPDGLQILIFIALFFILPGALIVGGLFKMRQKPGVYFEGIRTTPDGFETGSFTVDLESVEPRVSCWWPTKSGKVLTGVWTPQKTITADPLSVVIFLKQSRNVNDYYFFERYVIASKESVLHQIIGKKSLAETADNNIVAMLNGNFELLGGTGVIPCKSLLPALERIADVLSTAVSGQPPACTLNFVAKTVGLDKVLLFGVVGVLVAAGIESRRKGKLQKSFTEGRLFDAELTQKLADFAERRGWAITAGGK
jgi:hypothetical protein